MAFVYPYPYPYVASPVNNLKITQIKQTPYQTDVFTTVQPGVLIAHQPNPIKISDLNTSYMAQREMTKYLYYRILDKWFYSDELCHLLKYFTIVNNKVELIKSESDYKNVKVSNHNDNEIQLKVDYIQENFFSVKDMKRILTRIVQELGINWYDLPQREYIVVDVVESKLKQKIRDALPF